MSNRRILFDPDCDKAAETLGGYERLDASLSAYYSALIIEPKGFPRIESEWGSVRYIRTKPVATCPALVWWFIIEGNGDVVIVYVEEYDGY